MVFVEFAEVFSLECSKVFSALLKLRRCGDAAEDDRLPQAANEDVPTMQAVLPYLDTNRQTISVSYRKQSSSVINA